MKYILFTILLAGVAFGAISCKKRKKTSKSEVAAVADNTDTKESLLIANPYKVDAALAAAGSGDDFNIENSEIIGDSLILNVSYGGGCKQHIFSLYSNGSYLKSLPLQMELTLHHQANEDMCRAFLNQRLAFDIKGTRPVKGNELRIILNGNRDKILSYKF